ncbi:MAG TPA: hypothetical protein VEI97_01845, partial [bacterium]|nr:hypothetical protein [bacterium]
GGYLSRLPEERFAAFRADSVLMRLVRLQVDSGARVPLPSEAEVEAFRRRYRPVGAVVQRAHGSAAMRRYVGALVGGRVWVVAGF